MVEEKPKLNKNGKPQGMHPNSQVNLGRRWVDNNHASKDYSIARILKEMANDPAPERWLEVEDKGKGLTYRQAAARRIWIEVLRGNAKLTSELLDRVDGKVTQPIGGDSEKPIYVINIGSEKGKEDIKRVLNGERT